MYSGAMNMAIDRWLATDLKGDEGILRFYGWRPFCISIGMHQHAAIVDPLAIQQKHIDLIRRPTGGRAIYHAEELTYALSFSRSVIGHRQLYEFFHNVLAAALRKMGYNVDLSTEGPPLPAIRNTTEDFACFNFSAHSEIQWNGRKLVGSAQKLYPESILQHGSILIGREHMKLAGFLGSEPGDQERMKRELERNTTTLFDIRPDMITPAQISDAILRELATGYNLALYARDLTRTELKQARLCLET